MINSTLKQLGINHIEAILPQCTEHQILKFQRIYQRGLNHLSLDEIANAIRLIEASIKQNQLKEPQDFL